MKKLQILILIFGLAMSCDIAKSTQQGLMKIEMTRTGMAGYVNSTFTPEKFTMESKRVGSTEGTSTSKASSKGGSYSQAWKDIVQAVAVLDLNQMNTWESPTNERLYDGADVMVITIQTKDGTYESLSFDNGKPPAELEKLYSLLENVVNQ